MFRRKEDGSDPIEATNDNRGDQPVASYAPAAPAAAAAPAPAPAVPATPVSAPAAAAPNAPAFRPVPPQAAMVAAQRANAAPAPAPAAPAPAPAPAPVAAAAPAAAAVEPQRPSAPVARPNAKRVLTVGPDIQMKGEVTSCDRVIIEGTVDATMRDVHTVELSETGTLKGTAEVEDAEISGSFEGDLVVRGRLTVHTTGRVRGNITYGEIEIQRGGQISGNIRNVADAKAAQQSVKKVA